MNYALADQKTSLLNLPFEIIEKIIGYILRENNRSLVHLVQTCKFMQIQCDEFVKRIFLLKLRYYILQEPTSQKCAAFRVFVESTLPFMRYMQITPLNIEISQMIDSSCNQLADYLFRFYHRMDYIVNKKTRHRRNLTFGITLMSILQKFSEKNIIVRCHMNRTCEINVVLKGVWLGILWSQGNQSRLSDADLLTVLAEILLFEYNKEYARRIWDNNKSVYIYGYFPVHLQNERNPPKIVFKIMLRAENDLQRFFIKCLKTNRSHLTWPKRLLTRNFQLNVRFKCNQANKWGCSTEYYTTILSEK